MSISKSICFYIYITYVYICFYIYLYIYICFSIYICTSTTTSTSVPVPAPVPTSTSIPLSMEREWITYKGAERRWGCHQTSQWQYRDLGQRDLTQESSKGNSRLKAVPHVCSVSPEWVEDTGLQERYEIGTFSQMFGHLENNINVHLTDTMEHVKI